MNIKNRIEFIPKEVGQLTNLEYLSIVNNPCFRTLPESFSSIKSLKDLRCDQILNIPKYIYESRVLFYSF